MPRYTILASIAFAALVSVALPSVAEDKADAVIAKVGDLEIRQSDLDVAITNLDPQLAQLPDEQKKVAALSGAIDLKLFAKDAAAEKLDQSEDFKARMKYITERELHGAYFKKHVIDVVKPEDIKARYE